MIKTPNKKTNHYIYIFLAVVTFVTYMGVLNNNFVNYDDDAYVTENLHTQTGLTFDSIKWAFTTFYCANWHPLTWLSHMADCELFGLKPCGHHLVNLLIHIVNVLLLFGILKAMTGAVWRSAFVAAIFAVHPLNVESVAWVAERKNVLSTMFWFLAIGSYWQYSKGQNLKWYLLTLLLFAMGLMSKPMVVTLPFTLLLLDYWPLERLKNFRDWKAIWKLVIEKVPFFVLSVVSGIVTFLGQKSDGIVAKIETVPLSFRLANAIISYGKYIVKGIWPVKLGVLYPLFNEIEIWKAAVLILGLAAISIFLIKNGGRRKYLIVGWFWYLGTLVPVIGLVQVGIQSMADRYAYVPMIGLLIIVGWGAWDLTEQWANRKAILRILAGCVIVALSILTYIQIGYWKSSVTLFERTMAVATKANSIIFKNLGVAYNHAGRYKDAIQIIEKVIELNPKDAEAYSNLGRAYLGIGDYKGAIEACKEAIRLQPMNDKAYCNLGMAYIRLGDLESAVKAFEKSISIKPNAESYLNLGVAAYDKAGEYEKEIEAYRKAIDLKPNFAEAWYNLGNVYAKLMKYVEAKEAFKKATAIKPNFEEAHLDIGRVYIYLGDKKAAMMEYEILRTINPQTAERLMAEINKGIRQTVPTK